MKNKNNKSGNERKPNRILLEELFFGFRNKKSLLVMTMQERKICLNEIITEIKFWKQEWLHEGTIFFKLIIRPKKTTAV